MFKEENIELGWKLFCFFVFFIVISFLNSIFSLLILFAFFFLINRKKDDSIGVAMLYLLTLLGIAVGFINNNLWFLKLFLIIDFCYYFIRYIKKNKQSFFVKCDNDEEVNVITDTFIDVTDGDNGDNLDYYDSDEIVVSDDKINAINNELKKGNLLKDEDVNLIKSHLIDKEKDDLEEKKYLRHLRFSNLKNGFKFSTKSSSKSNSKSISKSYKWQFSLDDINSLYVMCHLLILILAIVVE